MANTYKCPLCHTPLTKAHFHQVVKLKQEEEKAVKKRATAVERSKRAQTDKRLIAQISKLQEENRMLKRRTTPQEVGLADEEVLLTRLSVEFRGDNFVHTGKGGDILHIVRIGDSEVGAIVYECKHMSRIQADHVQQTARAKKERNASYAILVHTGKRRGFSGLDQDNGIFIVAQAGVMTLARLCRDSLITMAKQRLDAVAKDAAAKRLMDYVTGPLCKTPLGEAIQLAERAHENLIKEVKAHVRDWNERHEIYKTIYYDTRHIAENIDLVIAGSEPRKLEKMKVAPLALPQASGPEVGI